MMQVRLRVNEQFQSSLDFTMNMLRTDIFYLVKRINFTFRNLEELSNLR